MSVFGAGSPPPVRFPSIDEFGYVELRGGDSRVVIVPALGGKITSMELAGREWLWTSDVTPYAPPVEGASYVETADTGGFDECFPTVGPSRVPTWVKSFGGVELPDHGELWSQEPAMHIETSADGQRAVSIWTGRRMPYRFSREVMVTPRGEVVTSYEVRNTGTDRLPFIWSSHPLLPLTPATRLDLPHGSRVRVHAQHEIEIGDAHGEQRWPLLRVAGKMLDFSHPDAVAKRYACKLFLDVSGSMLVAVEEGDVRLEAAFDSADVPNIGLWLNRQGWTPFKRGAPYMNMAFEPCIGAPDTLSDALGGWKSAHWIDAGAARRWSILWRGRRVERE